MTKEIKITNHSSFDNYTIKDNGENHSAIVSKMVQLAGRICEHYASDIVYDAEAFIEAINNNEDFDRYLFFREMGVTAFKPEDIECIDGTIYIQAWHLTYNAETQEQELTRVDIHFERKW